MLKCVGVGISESFGIHGVVHTCWLINGVIRGSSTSVKYLKPDLWDDLHPREKLNVKYSTRIYLQCP